jgi:hypothetical protein
MSDAEEAKPVSGESREGAKEPINFGFEIIKHVTTLSAGSIVLLATFLKDIFTPNLADLPPVITGAIVLAFASFGLSLVFATNWSLVGFPLLFRSRRLLEADLEVKGEVTERFRTRYRTFVIFPCFFYSLGLISFTYAALAKMLDPGPFGNYFLTFAFIAVFVVLVNSTIFYLRLRR